MDRKKEKRKIAGCSLLKFGFTHETVEGSSGGKKQKHENEQTVQTDIVQKVGERQDHSEEVQIDEVEKDVHVGSCKEQDTSDDNRSAHEMPMPFESNAALDLLKMFKADKVHNSAKCAKTCDLTLSEKKRIAPKKFSHSLISEKYWWLCFVEGEGMFCLLCMKHKMKHDINKRSVFVTTPSQRFISDAVRTHAESGLHKSAYEIELTQKFSAFELQLSEKKTVETSVYEKAFHAAYFLMKSFIANRQFVPLINFIQNVFDFKDLKYFDHRSQGSQREVFLFLGEAVKKKLMAKLRTAGSYGLLVDEVSDVSVAEHLISFIQYYDCETRQTSTSFLSCQSILEEYESANAESITKLILQSLADNELEVSKLTGFSSDGASVMVGSKNGVATQLRNQNPSLINIHCVCHKLALSCSDTNDSVRYIKNVEDWLRQLWYFFQNSPKRMAQYLKTQIALKQMNLSRAATKNVASRLKKACRTRWLSLEASVKALFEDYEAVLQTLNHFEKSDATASGLLKKIKSIKFLGVLYILMEVLPVLGKLSRCFQRDSLNFSIIKPQVEFTINTLDEILEKEIPIQKLASDIDSISKISDELSLQPRGMDELRNVFTKYIPALKQNIIQRFEPSSEIVAALGVLNPLSVPGPNQPGFNEYGVDEIQIIADHFFMDKDKLLAEWKGMKYHIRDVLVPKMPGEVSNLQCKQWVGRKPYTPTEWLLLQLLGQPTYRTFFPSLVYIAEVAVTLPVTNAWPERGASALKNIKTRLRSRINPDMLNSLLQVCINGPASCTDEAQVIVKDAVTLWLKDKQRKKLAKKSNMPVPNPSVSPVASRSVDVQTEPVIVVDQETLREEVQAALKAFNIETDCQADLEADCESDSSISESECEQD